mmetsp:Transcript_31643/g.80299  ORF Transcript_31643/g.80299 Transcript_31643/m.80299 type:complete len:307 (+) Transcript_31643:606-1526(+)
MAETGGCRAGRCGGGGDGQWENIVGARGHGGPDAVATGGHEGSCAIRAAPRPPQTWQRRAGSSGLARAQGSRLRQSPRGQRRQSGVLQHLGGVLREDADGSERYVPVLPAAGPRHGLPATIARPRVDPIGRRHHAVAGSRICVFPQVLDTSLRRQVPHAHIAQGQQSLRRMRIAGSAGRVRGPRRRGGVVQECLPKLARAPGLAPRGVLQVAGLPRHDPAQDDDGVPGQRREAHCQRQGAGSGEHASLFPPEGPPLAALADHLLDPAGARNARTTPRCRRRVAFGGFLRRLELRPYIGCGGVVDEG